MSSPSAKPLKYRALVFHIHCILRKEKDVKCVIPTFGWRCRETDDCLEKLQRLCPFPLFFLLNFLVLTVSCCWHQQFHFKWSFNIDIPPCLPFFLGQTFAWQMVQMAQQTFTGSVLERQSKAQQNKNTPAARLMTFWHHIMCHQSTGRRIHHRKIIVLNLLDFSENFLNFFFNNSRGQIQGQELLPFLLRVFLFLVA